jgi:hypothetical protein
VVLIFQLQVVFKSNEMKIVNKIVLITTVIIVVFFACDEIEDPFIEYDGQCGDASLPVPIKQILIEEFTGHQCGNCPVGAETIETLKELYCDHIIPVAIHAGYFAEVKASGDKYTYDYRSDDGNTIDTYFEASSSGVPNAMINRAEIDGDLTLNPADWSTVVAELVLQKPVLDININTSLNHNSREVTMDIDVLFIESSSEELMLSVYIVEDSIASWQKDYSLPVDEQDVEEYEHNHVLRDAINGTWGDQITTGPTNAEQVISKSYIYSINSNWKIQNSSIVAFVYKNDTKEVLQASQKYLN